MKFDLKTDPNYPHHYILAVATKSALSKNPGKLYLKYRPIHFTNDDVENMQHAAMLTQDKLFKTTDSEAFAAVGKTQLAAALTMMKMGAAVNQCSLHHFSTEEETSEEMFESIVNMANSSIYYRDLLKNSRIGGGNG